MLNSTNNEFNSAAMFPHNLTLDGKLCLRDDKNAVFVYLHHLLPWEARLENVTMYVRISRNPFLIG